MPSIDARLLRRRTSGTLIDQVSTPAEGVHQTDDVSGHDRKPSRRKSELPAGTQDPIIRNASLCDTLLILTSLDDHLASGFSTTFPEQVAKYCNEALWTQFILDVNEAAKLKKKDKLVIQIRPAVKRIKFLNRAIESRLEKRTKPILNVLKYWQEVLKTYGIHVELRKDGIPLKRKLILQPMAEMPENRRLRTRSSSSFADLSRSVRSSWVSAQSSFFGTPEAKPADSRSSISPISLDDLPIRAPFLNSNISNLSLASSRSLTCDKNAATAKNNWELVVFTGFKRRSQVPSLYSQSRRFSTYSLPQTKTHARPSSVSMVASEELPSLTRSSNGRSASSGGQRNSRTKVLTLEELARLPLPASSSPFMAETQSDSGAQLESESYHRMDSYDRAKSLTNPLRLSSSYSSMPRRALPPTPREDSYGSGLAMPRSTIGQESFVSSGRNRQSHSASSHRRSFSAQAMITAELTENDRSTRRRSGSYQPPVLSDTQVKGKVAVVVRRHSPPIHSKAGSIEDLNDTRVLGRTVQPSRSKSALSKTDSLFADENCLPELTNDQPSETGVYANFNGSTLPAQNQSQTIAIVDRVNQRNDQASTNSGDLKPRPVSLEGHATSHLPVAIKGKPCRESFVAVSRSPLATMSHTPETMLAEEINKKMRLSSLMSSATSIFTKSLTNLTSTFDFDKSEKSSSTGGMTISKPLPSIPSTASKRTVTNSSFDPPSGMRLTRSRGRSATQKEIDFFDAAAAAATVATK